MGWLVALVGIEGCAVGAAGVVQSIAHQQHVTHVLCGAHGSREKHKVGKRCDLVKCAPTGCKLGPLDLGDEPLPLPPPLPQASPKQPKALHWLMNTCLHPIQAGIAPAGGAWLCLSTRRE